MREQVIRQVTFSTVSRNKKTIHQCLEKKGVLYCLLCHPILKPYHRLWVLVIAINVVLFWYTSEQISLLNHQILPQTLLYFVLANFGVGIFIRQQQVINALFKIAISVPKSWPLSFRWSMGKIYHFGGIHVGGYFSGAMWFGLFLVTITLNPPNGIVIPDSVRLLGMFHFVIFLSVMYVSLPKFREKHHNIFETVARFGNWTSLMLFWFQAVALILTNHQDSILLTTIFQAPEIWVLAYLTFCVARPWLHLKKIPVKSVAPSNHVSISEFDYGVIPFAGSSTDLSLSPLFEWHSFANIPAPNKSGFRLCISKAGDWTGEYINKKPEYIWVKGIPTAGVGNIELLFKKVVWIATGSGVGPCIPHLLDQKVPSQLIWSTRSPRKTYGDALVDEVLKVQPNALLWDTTEQGRPDLVDLALKAYQDFKAEAVIVIANKKLTFHVNYELESRGIPCFGAIWDS